jgi:two-component system sensor histidine kinase ChvG
VVVPRLPDRGDEIGLLARAFSDMTMALRHRIDAVESFAADVAHELKNPLASLASAIESLDRVEDPTLRRQLTAIATHDVQRIDRLITEIADASRIDAELSRATFVRLDLGQLAAQVVGARGARYARRRGDPPGPAARFAAGADGAGRCHAAGAGTRKPAGQCRIVFPPGGAVDVTVWTEWGNEGEDPRVLLSVADEGPGIPAAERDKVFERFHSVRPPKRPLARTAGRAGHCPDHCRGARRALDDHGPRDGGSGACLVLALPHAGEGQT